MNPKTSTLLPGETRSAPSDVGRLLAPFTRELQTPLASLLASSEMMMEEMDPRHQCSGYARLIHDASSRLHETVAELASVVAPPPLSLRLVDLARLLREQVRRVRADAQACGVRVSVVLPGDSLSLLADVDALRLALDKLLAHQIAVSPSGAPVEMIAEAFSPRTVHILSSDRGPEVPQELLPHVFDPFFECAERRPGLALALVKRIVEQHRGSVRAWRNRHNGLTVALRIPTTPPSDIAEEERR